jgi:hypothetical protein
MRHAARKHLKGPNLRARGKADTARRKRAGSLSSDLRKAVIARASGQEPLAGKNFADCVYGAIENGALAALWLVELTAWAPSRTEWSEDARSSKTAQ